jgi:hypothetical protein
MTALERRPPATAAARPKALVLYHPDWLHVKSVAHHLESFHLYSRCDVAYVSSLSAAQFDVDCFSAVVVHCSARVCHPGHISRSWLTALREYSGVKAIYLQDEYENVHLARQSLVDLGFQFVFTCVPEESIAKVYPPAMFPKTKFVNVLTGCVPPDVDAIPQGPPMHERRVLIGYRGRNLGYWYGDLGQEKVDIGRRMKRVCDERGLPCDIGWEESDRIYGDGWFHFLGNCRATLGTESGANVFDWDGTLRTDIQREVLRNPNVGYDEIRERFLKGREGEVVMNQISPKMFEAVATRTALVLYEGRYSGVLEPHRHFLPLKKDFGNVDDVLRKVQDASFLAEMTDRTYDDIVRSGRYDYQSFVEIFDRVVGPALRPAKAKPLSFLPLPNCEALTSFRLEAERSNRPPLVKRLWNRLPLGFRERLKPWIGRDSIKNAWIRAPKPIQAMLNPLVGRAKRLLRP